MRLSCFCWASWVVLGYASSPVLSGSSSASCLGRARTEAKSGGVVIGFGRSLERERASLHPLSVQERSNILDDQVRNYVQGGYRVESRTPTTAQLVRPKKFSFLWALLWFLLFGIGILVYVAYYLAKSDQTVYLEVDDEGKVRKS